MDRERYIERVLGMIVKDTKIDLEKFIIVYPFEQPLYSLNTNFYLPLHENFYDYCVYQYGLTKEECKDLWFDYSDVINKRYEQGLISVIDGQQNLIDENYSYGELEPMEWDVKEILGKFGYDDERYYKFIMKLYNSLVNSITETDKSDDRITIKINLFGHTDHSVFGLTIYDDNFDDRDNDFKIFSEAYTTYILKGCISLVSEVIPNGHVLGIMLTDMVLKYIYERWFQSGYNINESESKEDRFLDKVYQFLIDDTYEIKRNKIKLPFLNVNVSIKHDTISKYSILDVITYPSVPHMFVKYCDITYGLDLKQITILWNRYKEYLMGNFNNLKKLY